MQSVDSWATIWPPLTLAILAQIARRHGEVDLFDGNVEEGLDHEGSVDRVRRFDPDLIVVNTAFPSVETDGRFADAIREACPEVPMVGFGLFFTVLGAEAMEALPAFQIGIRGEPEQTFAELLDAMAEGRSFEGLPGLMWRQDGSDAVGMAHERPYVDNLDDIPMAARDLLRNNEYRLPHNGRPFTLINVARGCPYPCIYCLAPAYYGKALRRHSLGYVIEELEHCQQQLGIDQFLFWEEIFTLDRQFGLDLCEEILRRDWKISWATTTRADRVDLELLRKMKEAGCDLLGLGIESGVQEILDQADKRETVDDMVRAVDLCRQAGLRTMGHFIFGLPGETAETIEQTIDFGVRLGLDYMQCYPAIPYPGTRLGELARENGWIASERWQDYNFGGASILAIGTVTPARVDQARRDMFRRFYFRPGYVARQVGRLLTRPRQLLQAARFLRWI